MNVTFNCTNCQMTTRAQLCLGAELLVCRNCSAEIPLKSNAMEGPRVQLCPVCATVDLYIQKDFPQLLGLAIVGLGIVLSSIAWWQYWYPTALGILLLTAALDLVLYYLVGDVTVCYRCLSQYRGAERNPDHQAFDLEVGERYRQERLRLEQLRHKTKNS